MISKFSLVYEILNLIRPLTLDMIRRLPQTKGFLAKKNFIHRRHSLPA
jgi:antitoxin component HigA of HigAB toxin-antitoxin module